MKESETGRERESYTVQIYLGISIITRVLIHGVCYITNNKKRQIENTAIWLIKSKTNSAQTFIGNMEIIRYVKYKTIYLYRI